jgi:hypothetical protein
VRRAEDGPEDPVIADGVVPAAGKPIATKIRYVKICGA